jgi:hypothetical protein
MTHSPYANKQFTIINNFPTNWKIITGILIITLIGYWPITTGLFALKNDDIIYFLPYRYNIVENIRNGHFPLWTPYIYMGFPISGDMQSGAWNPIVWLFALGGRYTLTSLHIEILIYIFISGIGTFRLFQYLKFSPLICWTVTVSYMYCSFITNTGQILAWVIGAAFIPYTILYFIKLLNTPGLKTAATFALALSALLVISGYPFFFIALCYLLLIAFLIQFIINTTNNNGLLNKKIVIYGLLSIILFLIVCAAPFFAFYDLLPFYHRGSGLSLKMAITNVYAPVYNLSTLSPFLVNNNESVLKLNSSGIKNAYFGILLIPFVVYAFVMSKARWLYVVLGLTVLAWAMAMATVFPLRIWSYFHLPLMNTFRHTANFRIFFIGGILFLAACGLQQFKTAITSHHKQLKWGYICVILLCAVCIIVFKPDTDALISKGSFFLHHLNSQGLKTALTNSNFNDSVFFGMLLQLPFLLIALFCLHNKNFKWLCYTSMVNMVIIAQPQIFIGMVSKESTTQYNQYIKNVTSGFPKPSTNESLGVADLRKPFIFEYKEPIQMFFEKKVAINPFLKTPTCIKTYIEFVLDPHLPATVQHYPFCYFADTIINLPGNNTLAMQKRAAWVDVAFQKNAYKNQNDTMSFASFGPNAFSLSTTTKQTTLLSIFQTYHRGWCCTIDNKKQPIQRVNRNFMAVQVPAGTHLVKFAYQPYWFLPGIILSIIGLSSCIIFIIYPLFKANEKGSH